MGTRRRLLGALALAGAALSLAAPAASASDAGAAATPLSSGVAARADTTAYGVEAGEQNTVAPFPQQCGSDHTVGAARTAWYTVQGTGGAVTVTTSGSDFDTALFVYAGGPAGTLVACNDDVSGAELQSAVSFTSTAGATYAIQVGRACNETGPPKCVDNPPAGQLAVTATVVTPNHDLDGDGYVGAAFGGPDCNDASAAIHPGAPDVPHDGVDQDCSGADAPYPALAVDSSMSVLYFARYTKVAQLKVTGAPVGATVTLSCASKSKGCTFTRKTVAVTSTKPLQLGRYLKKAKLKKGAAVSVLVARPGFIGSLFRYSIRLRHLPRKTKACVEPGQTKPATTCS